MESEEIKQADEYRRKIENTLKERAIKVKAFFNSDGFKIIQEDFVADSKRLTTELLDATDLVEVQRLQAEIKALQKFFDKIAHYGSIKT